MPYEVLSTERTFRHRFIHQRYIFREDILRKKEVLLLMGKVDVAVEVSGAVPCESARGSEEDCAEC